MAALYAYHFSRGASLHTAVLWVTVAMVFMGGAAAGVRHAGAASADPATADHAARLAHQVHHDSLTGLPNRVLFARRLDEAMQTGRSC